MGYTVKANTTYIQTVDSDYSKSNHQEMSQECNVVRPSHHTTSELRNVSVKLNEEEHVYYNDKQVFLLIQHATACKKKIKKKNLFFLGCDFVSVKAKRLLFLL